MNEADKTLFCLCLQFETVNVQGAAVLVPSLVGSVIIILLILFAIALACMWLLLYCKSTKCTSRSKKNEPTAVKNDFEMPAIENQYEVVCKQRQTSLLPYTGDYAREIYLVCHK